MQAEIITIGDEILIGQIVDTNSAWIAEKFAQNGINVGRIVSVSDRADQIEQAITDALSRAQIVVTTGGLGPTKDDITKITISGMFGMQLVRDQATYDHVKRFTELREIEFNQSNQSQALVPEGCTVLHNRNGSAPGMVIEQDGKLLFSLAGVPFEMKALITEQVLPLIHQRFELQSSLHRTIVTYGMAESILSETIEPWESALPEYLHLAYLPNPRGIRLRLSAYDIDKESVAAQIESQFAKLRTIIEPYYLGYEPASTESALSALLSERQSTLAVAESCTGGLISTRITALEGASKFYLGSVTAYSNDVKRNLLGVSSLDLETYGAVSQQVVEQMAIGVRELMKSDYSMATTGIAGPGGGTAEKPVGTVWVAIAWQGGVESHLLHLGNLREQNSERAATSVINMLRLHITQATN